MERRKFEDSFKDAFKDAEVNPSEEVWTNIELELEKADGGKARRIVFFYKMLAAASVTFALAFAGIGYYIVDRKTKDFNNQLTAIRDSANTTLSKGTSSENFTAGTTPHATDARKEATENASANLQANATGSRNETTEATHQNLPDTDSRLADKATSTPAGERTLADRRRDNTTNGPSDTRQDQSSINTGVAVQKTDVVKGFETVPPGTFPSVPAGVGQQTPFGPAFTDSGVAPYDPSSRKLPALYTQKKREIVPESKPDAVALLMARLADAEKEFAKEEKNEKKNNSEKLWTSVGFAAGGFNAVNANTSSVPSASFLAMSNSSVPDKQAKASGVAYSFGVSVGTRVAKRWVLQGGVNYLSQSSDYVATNVVTDANLQGLKAESINELDKLPQLSDASTNKLAPTVPYSVNNNVQFFSVPVQAGYLVINKKFGLQLNGGVSTDLFLQNTITPQGGSLDKTTQGRGEDSPYRAVNFSGLMGTEISYRFGTRYRVSLNPGVRYPLNSVYKSDVGIQSTPLTFDVGLRFRYIFH